MLQRDITEADNLKLYLHIVDVCDIDKLQLALNALTDWENTWQLYISPNKCCVLSVGKNHSEQLNLFVSHNALPVVNCRVDLGITVLPLVTSPIEHTLTVLLP